MGNSEHKDDWDTHLAWLILSKENHQINLRKLIWKPIQRKRNSLVIIVKSLETQKMYAEEKMVREVLLPYKIVIIIIVIISMYINHLSVDSCLSKYLRGIHLIVTTILVKSLDTSLKISNHKCTLIWNQGRRIMLLIGIRKHSIHVLHVGSMVIFLHIAWGRKI